MRVNPDSSARFIAAVQSSQEQVQTALAQLGSGRRVLNPSDDPAASSLFQRTVSNESQNSQFLANSEAVVAVLSSADSILGNVVSSLTKAVSLGVQGANGTLSPADREQIAASIDGLSAELLQLGNTTFRGSFLFGGTNSTSEPFTIDSSSPSGVTYQGNHNSNSVQVGETLELATSLAGDQIFSNPSGDAFGSLKELSSALRSGDSAAIATATDRARSALSIVSQQRVFYGSTIGQINANKSYLQQQSIGLKEDENRLVGIDLAEAATNLSQAQLNRSALLAAFAKVLPQSLLDYLK